VRPYSGVAKAQVAGVLLVVTALAALHSTAPGNASSVARYGGLGATVAAFRVQNPHGPGFPPLGVAYYTIDRTRADRVLAYHVEINARPRFGNQERILLLGGINLPRDATPTGISRSTCIVWRSATLKRLIGMAYAAGTTDPGTTRADMRAELRPRC
jgi:hypothetical protein